MCWNETGRSQGNNVKALPENGIVDLGALKQQHILGISCIIIKLY